MSTATRTYSVAEAARRLGCSRGRVEQLVKDGRLVPFRHAPMMFDDEAIDRCKTVWPEPVGRKPGYSPGPDAKHGGGRPRKITSE